VDRIAVGWYYYNQVGRIGTTWAGKNGNSQGKMTRDGEGVRVLGINSGKGRRRGLFLNKGMGWMGFRVVKGS